MIGRYYGPYAICCYSHALMLIVSMRHRYAFGNVDLNLGVVVELDEEHGRSPVRIWPHALGPFNPVSVRRRERGSQNF